MFLSIIIPVFNEEVVILEAIKAVVQFFKEKNFDFEVIVVDDGSTDETDRITAEVSRENSLVKLIRLEKNQGKGAAVKTGVLSATGEWILFLDADLSTRPEEFLKLAPYLDSHDIVIGSRAIAGAEIKIHQSILRELAGRILNLIFRLVLGLPYYDTQCGFKIFNHKTQELFRAQQVTRWLFDVELLYLAKKYGFKVKEVPIVWSDDRTSQVKITHLGGIIRDLFRIKKLHQ